MEVDETIPMDEEDLMFNTCLKHSENWRNRFQNLLNLLRDNPFKQEIIFRIGKVVCICDPQQRVIDGSLASLSSVDPQVWQGISENDHRAAQEHFERFIDGKDHCSEAYSHLQYHYKQMRECNVLGDGDTSAKRFIYLFYRIHKFKDLTLLKPFRPSENQGPPKYEFELPLTKLKEEYIGLFIGKRGRKLKQLMKPFRNSRVTVKKEGDILKATISCREEDKNKIIQTITDTEDFIVISREAHELRVKEYMEEQERMLQEMETGDGDSNFSNW